jgi:hypothetical protein
VDERSFSGGTRARNALRWPGCPPRFREDGGAGGLRFVDGHENGRIRLLPVSAGEGILERFTIGLRTARHEADSYEPEAQASEFPESMHSLALRARIKCAQPNR